MKKVVYILRAVPGAGKSTLAQQLSGGKDWLVFEADKLHYHNGVYDWRPENVKWAHEKTFKSFCDYTAQGISPLVVSNTNTKEWEFSHYMREAEAKGYVVFSLIIENRHDGKNVHNVPAESLQRMEQNLRSSLKLR